MLPPGKPGGFGVPGFGVPGFTAGFGVPGLCPESVSWRPLLEPVESFIASFCESAILRESLLLLVPSNAEVGEGTSPWLSRLWLGGRGVGFPNEFPSDKPASWFRLELAANTF